MLPLGIHIKKKKKKTCWFGLLWWPAVKHPPVMQETWVPSLGREGSLEKEMATHSSILAWRIPWTEESGGPQSMGSQTVWHDWVTNIFTLLFAYPYVTLVLTGYNSQMQRSVSCSKPLFPSSFFSDQNKWFWSLEKKKQTSNSRWVRLFIGLVTVCHTVPMILTNSSSECIL